MSRTMPASLVGLALVLVAAGCGSSSAEPDGSGTPNRTFENGPVAIGDTTSLHLGESVAFGDTGIEVTFLRLAADSRCPIGVTCVWEGDAEVRVLLETAEGRSEEGLHTALEPQAVRIGGYMLELLDVLPYPIEGQAADPATRHIVITLVEAGTGS